MHRKLTTARRLAGTLFAAVVMLPACLGAAEALRSPWDCRPVATEPAAMRCPRPMDVPSVVEANDYYSDAAHSAVDRERKQAYDDAVRPLRSAALQVVAMADRYRESGQKAVAACAGRWLDSFARAGSLAGPAASNQAVYVQGWMLSALAVAYLKVRASGDVGAEASASISAWLAQVGERQVAYYDRRAGKVDGRNNHRFWAGLAVMAVGIASDRPDLFGWGLRSFRIGASQVTSESTLPLEMDRRALALHYHLFAAAALVTTAELASANGLDLYAAYDRALVRLVRRAVAGIDDPRFFAERAGAPQEPIRFRAEDVVWLTPYVQRFQDPAAASILERTNALSFLYIGGTPPPGRSCLGAVP